jgi:chondroitin 4-sulfotransferase 11
MRRLLWSTSLRAVDAAKQRLKRSRVIRSFPLLHYTYLFDLSKAIVVPELGVVFVPTPKVANRSMKAAMAQTLNPGFQGDPHQGWQYVPVALMRDNDYFRFGFVRNPLDRLLSCYSQKIVHYARRMNMPLEFWRYGSRFHKDMSFEEFVTVIADIPDRLADIHIRSQHTFFYHKGQLMVDFVGRFENLEADWNTLRERFGFPALPHYNRSSHADFRDMYTPSIAQLAASRYQRDIELFGYEKSIGALLTGE